MTIAVAGDFVVVSNSFDDARELWHLSFMRCISFLPLLLMAGCTMFKASAPLVAPAPPREARAAWVATVGNIDWPSKPGLSVDQQLAEMGAILDKAVELRLNILILQVRTSCDAFYASPYEPWSEFLTGKQGVAPSPYYDPLAAWVREAHARGIELHAWFNPFRAKVPDAKGPRSADHISQMHPDWVKGYGKFLWLDPGEEGARQHTLDVISDVVRRYDIDGVHIDDYFYPYPIQDDQKKEIDFPDDASFKAYQQSGGNLSRADWRRDNINRMIRRIYDRIKSIKPHVQFGISPFGIWQPDYPKGVKGFNQYEKLYADARLWLNQGWCDYFSPQLYWQVSSTGQPYKDLLTWWSEQNSFNRHLWPGNYTSRINNTEKSWQPAEILEQIEVTREVLPSDDRGNVHFSMVALLQNRRGMADALRDGPYAQSALVPSTTWVASGAPLAPRYDVISHPDGSISMAWRSGGDGVPWLWGVWVKTGQTWQFSTYPAGVDQVQIRPRAGQRVDAVTVGAVNRLGYITCGPVRSLGR